MKIIVVGAAGQAGSRIVAEAVDRGHEVTAVTRREVDTPAQHALVKDAFDLSAADIKGADVVVDALSFPNDPTQHVPSVEVLADAAAAAGARLLVVGGAGSLFVDAEHTRMLAQTPEFPAEFLATAEGQIKQLAALRERDDVDWTFISPAADFRADGPRTGNYQLAGEEFTTNAAGESVISYADYASGLVDEAERTGDAAHRRARVSLLGS
ncbi:NAD(P)-dependent oxidoreductase [Corynebacterium uberis]|uniref:NAD(P)-dependent oxidoreductase n=1 Tax=Corynebacterium TaxID=1716 RepID=UPI001D0A5D2E|nr:MULTISPECIES: NAD(P)H-binding protein [Corynebacterium]MCZ9309672.1 NAD(P)H-binding protein [Corynebacterium sp. c6VSa_13]UDL73476.1 NAD(P)H-binding protein [Corynebacterium uberis]UDL75644.1 NAD(P)H-binding protein [Corynebacterium uberis]UDL77857.1 NAD(P)H-binding protein [Corynebacterium uberis]UDL80140.1 NAD(P)H-binding protein [Corynebacterium uberis]